MTRTLYGLSQSPWTERARWALDHHGVAFTYHEHVPMLGEVLLRRKARTKKATVPLLIDGADVVMGSFEIARHAERIGRGAPLFPRDKDAEIARWVDVGERILRVGRAWLFRRLLASKAAQAEALPSFIPGGLRGALTPSAALAIRFLAKKYDVPADVDAEVEHTLRPLLQDVRAALAGGAYLLAPSSFSLADLAIASALGAVRPRDASPLRPATREAWTNEAVAADFGDVLAWRDTVYGKHR
ncbi:MAG: glutathione S-transferase [Labilithrix sp.]|nr:glutathione S-transferase [Labilithrix sp.]